GGGPFQTAALAFTGPGSGTAALDADGAGGAAPSVVTFTGVEAVTSGAGAADLAFSFATGGDQAVLEDDGNPGNGDSRLRSANGTFPTTTFARPSAGVTLTAGSGHAVTVSLAEVL